MNNTLKIALGVSGFAILLALTIPSNFNAPEAKEEAQAPVQAAPVAPSLAPRPAAPVYDEEEEDSNFTFGKPTLDAKPYSEQAKDNDETDYPNPLDSVQSLQQINSQPVADTTTRPRASRLPIPVPSNNAPAGRVEGNVLIE